MIYQEINLYDFRQAFIKMDRNYYSYNACTALFHWLDELEENYELDVIALTCEFVEETFEEIAAKYSIEADNVIDYLEDNTIVIYQTEDSVLYADF